MIKFAPVWLTPPGSLTSTLTEGSVVTLPLSVIDTAFTTTPNTAPVVLSVPYGTEIDQIRLMGVVLASPAYGVQGNQLTIRPPNGLPTTLVLEINRTPALAFDLLNGLLPPGLSIENGAITGTVGRMQTSEDVTFDFTIRVSNGARVADRTFSLVVSPTASVFSWTTASLPPFSSDDDLGFDYFDFGVFNRSDYLFRSLQGSSNTGIDAKIVLLPNSLGLPNIFDGLPSGVTLVNNTIKGSVLPNAALGRYLFKLGFDGQNSNQIIGQVVIQEGVSANQFDIIQFVWVTPGGSLGTLPETYPCAFSVQATDDTPITYKLAPGSFSLPPGLVLNADGTIQGKPLHVDKDMTFPFTVRATNRGGTTIDRAFSITIQGRFSDTTVLDVHFRPNSNIRTPMVVRYRELISNDFIFRGSDTNFGLQSNPIIYIVKGLKAVNLQSSLVADGPIGPDRTDGYSRGSVFLRLGPHKSVSVKNDLGVVLYEVIYREVIDPQTKAGGFSRTSDTPVEEPVVYRQSPSPLYIYPHSIRNIRFDLVKDVGFATGNPSVQKLLGPSGVECLPDWMRLPQTSDPSSMLGYVPALVVAYVNPGASEHLLPILNQDQLLPPNGREIGFDHFYTFSEFSASTSGTTFDDDTTVFDDRQTLFDNSAAQVVVTEDGTGI